MAVWRGHGVVACGDLDRALRAHSVRKSLVSGLYGTAVAAGEIDLDATLAELGIRDDPPLTEGERRATVRHLISARSGVYHPAAYAPESQERERPERGSHPPGTHWFYNNWDFNVAGVILERATGEDLFTAFAERIAGPIGMEDWEPGDGFRAFEPTKSRHPAHTFRISARDLARFGQLYLQEGRWGGRQVIPGSWVRESTRLHSEFEDGSGYGYMWWVHPAGSLDPDRYPALSRHDLFLARGSGGQGLWVVPGLELVAVHRGDTDHGRGVDGRSAWGLVERVAASRVGPPGDDLALEPMRPAPLSSQLPPADVPEYHTLPDSVVDDYPADYRMSPGAEIRVFLFRGKPYIHVPGEGDALLFATGPDRFTIRVLSGVTIRFERDGDGEVAAVVLEMGDRAIRAPAAE
jgi:CubicO group peptidase (beta-lactamase class C family)